MERDKLNDKNWKLTKKLNKKQNSKYARYAAEQVAYLCQEFPDGFKINPVDYMVHMNAYNNATKAQEYATLIANANNNTEAASYAALAVDSAAAAAYWTIIDNSYKSAAAVINMFQKILNQGETLIKKGR